MDCAAWAQAERTYMEECRHWLHRHPELSHEEKETAAFVAGELRKMGLEPRENVGGHGVTAVIEGLPGERCAGLRADLDALPVQEKTGCAFASETPGVMHACGHDCHTAMLLGAAKALAAHRNEFHGRVKLIFQPSEEDAAASGANKMIAAGCLRDPDVGMIFGQHVAPEVPKGCVGVRKGAMSAASDRFFIDIKGRASHAGAAPEQGIDALVIAAETVCALETVVARNVSPRSAAVLSIGVLQAGTRYNVVADRAHMEGTCRTLEPAVRELLPERMRAVVEGTALAMGGEAVLDYKRGLSAVLNPDGAVDACLPALREIFGEKGVMIEEEVRLAGEDFCFYGEQIPACFLHLGCGEAGVQAALHQDTFLPSDEILAPGAALLVRLATGYLNSPVPPKM